MEPFATIDAAIEDLRLGRIVVVCDDQDRENEGDLTIAAEFATPEAINFMAQEGRGLICLALTPERCAKLQLNPMARTNESAFETAFTVSVDARKGVTTGISAADRSHTIQVAIDEASSARDLVRPGHMFPLKARSGGVLERTGQTEAGVDLARLAGLIPAAVICEVINDDGTMARVPDLMRFCSRHGLKMVTVRDLVAYRQRHEVLVERVARAPLPTSSGRFTAVGYRSLVDGGHHLAIVKGHVAGREDVLVHVHRACVAGDVFGSVLCDCRSQLDGALSAIDREGAGVVVRLNDDAASACVHADRRQEPLDDFIAAHILHDLGAGSVRLIAEDPRAKRILESHGVEVTTAPRGSHPAPLALEGRRRVANG